jgi:hypothetical protein
MVQLAGGQGDEVSLAGLSKLTEAIEIEMVLAGLEKILRELGGSKADSPDGESNNLEVA